MLNLKKGLAVALAAATAFTFMPVSTLTTFATTNGPTTDGQTTNPSGIDSIKITGLSVSKETNSSNATVSAPIYLKEHDDTSKGKKVGAYRITVKRKFNNDSKAYEDVVQVASNDTVNKLTQEKSDATANLKLDTAANAFTDSSTSAIYGKETTLGGTWSSAPSTMDERTYVIKNVPTDYDDDDHTIKNVGGAKFVLYNTGVSGTVNVTITALTSTDDTAEELESSTITVTVPSGDEVFAIRNTPSILAEGASQKVVWTRSGSNIKSTVLEVRSDNKDVAWAYDDKRADSADINLGDQSGAVDDRFLTLNNGSDYGTFSIGTGVVGTANLDVYAKKSADDSDTDAIFHSRVTVKVTPKNGKLRVTYNVQRNQDAEQRTYTDDQEYKNSGNATILSADSDTWEVDNKGCLKIYDTPDPATADPTLKEFSTSDSKKVNLIVDKSGNVYSIADNTWKNGTTTIGGLAKTAVDGKFATTKDEIPVSQQTNIAWTDTTTYNAHWGNLPTAQFLAQNGQKTVQISATSQVSDAQDIKYSLVQYVGHYKKGADGKYALDTTSSVIGVKDGYNYFTEASRYGAISRTGLVTLKDTYQDAQLYAVVTVKGAKATSTAAERATSTYVIPISGTAQEPVSFFASNEKGYAEVDVKTSATDTRVSGSKTIYLSTKDHPTDTLKYYGNITADYVTGSVEDPTIVKFDQTTQTLTALKAGETDLVLKTLPAPDRAGTVIATFHVIVNDSASANAVHLTPVSVNRAHPTARVAATTDVVGTSAVFDTDYLYLKDDKTPSGYRKVLAADTEYNAINVSTTGYVTYNKNNGTVYVRAYAPATATQNPSGYTYVAVSFGQNKAENQLTVDKNILEIENGKTDKINASTTTTGSAITYTSSDDSVVSVAADGTVTAKKAGVATITVNASATDDAEAGQATVTVVVTDKSVAPANETTVPGKVSKIKLYNVKGAKLKINYSKIKGVAGYKVVYKYKKNGKQVRKTYVTTAGSKTVSVPKNTSVKVWVRAYNLNSKGQRVNGSYKTASKKTDKK